ncbi:hypothetical protein FOZG_18549 [Fusarium oxysporum Fo47]|uniref:Uncharacterized protein n=1 Tax=Fusarium oxysporum Fo47 TaxID=660027 RepID=W9JE40_FUSOX|nr:hypothetical protein FOZG_18549 [Fusarium oxysporum Fo47]
MEPVSSQHFPAIVSYQEALAGRISLRWDPICRCVSSRCSHRQI